MYVLVRCIRRLLPAAAVVAGIAMVPAPAHAYGLDGIPWPGSPATITYWNGTAYGAQVRQAAHAWNASGVRVRFRPVSRKRAKLLILPDGPISDDRGLHGIASLGYQPRNRIRIGTGGSGTAVVGIVAHELGHVLGLVHEDRRCALMNSAFWARCLSAPSCSILQRDDVRGAIRRYGGRMRALVPELCPSAPPGMALTRDADSARLFADVVLPGEPAVVGAVVRSAVGRCPDRPATNVEGRPGSAGTVLRVDITPRGALSAPDGRMLCVRAWSYDATGRVSLGAVTQQIALDPVAAG